MYQAYTTNLNPHQEFAASVLQNPTQLYCIIPSQVNEMFRLHPDMAHMRDKQLTKLDLWEGMKMKGKEPHCFTNAIVAAALVKDSLKTTPYGEVYERYSIQPSWMTGKLVIVKEDTHADDLKKTMLFLGRAVDVNEAKACLIPSLLDEMAKGSQKARSIFLNEMSADAAQRLFGNRQQAEQYLNEHFERLFLSEKPALFHVEHAATGKQEHKPVETWKLVRLAPSLESEKEVYGKLRNRVYHMVSTKLYQETIHRLEASLKNISTYQ